MENENQNQKPALLAFIGLGSLISLFLIWWVYFKPAATEAPDWASFLPINNAILNSLCAICLVLGRIAIAKDEKQKHIRYMMMALFFSALFLFSYLTHHHFNGDAKFLGEGFIRPVYFFILISHIILSVIMLPMILMTLWLAYKGFFKGHRKCAKLTYPIWLYVSVTGVAIVILLKLYNP